MNSNERYQRQIDLPQIGSAGQDQLKSSCVLVVGAGGLGCPALQYLAAAGIGKLIIVDFDRIEASNLNRQILFTPADLGRYKATVAKERLQQFNPQIEITAITEAFSTSMAAKHLPHCNVVLDCTDRPEARYLINDLCVEYDKPFVYAGIYRFEGQLAVFNFENGATYRCAFPKPETPKVSATCEDNGVLGTVPGILGIHQANEAIKAIALKDEVMNNKLLIFNFLNYSKRAIKLQRQRQQIPHTNTRTAMNEISPDELMQRLKEGEQFTFVDVREPFEQTAPEELKAHNLPTSEWNPDELIPLLQGDKPTVIFCQHGVRSRAVIDSLPPDIQKQLINLRGGLAAYLNDQQQNN